MVFEKEAEIHKEEEEILKKTGEQVKHNRRG